MAKMFGVDMGTYSMKMYNHSTKEILYERNMIAIRDKDEVIAFGDDAYEMYGKTPDNIKIHSPIRNSVIAHVNQMETLFHCFYNKLAKRHIFKSSKFCLALPLDITEVEKRAVLDVIADAKVHAKEIFLTDRPLADAIGIGLDLFSPGGSLIVNIGADHTEITALSMGGIVTSKIVPSGGNQINEGIQSVMRKKESLQIGDRTAEMLKTTIADATGKSPSELKIFGMSTITGLPTSMIVPSSFIYNPVKEVLKNIAEQIRLVLDKIPPEFGADIANNGIYVTGGSANLTNIGSYLAKEINMKVNIAENPSESTIRGIARMISEPALKKQLMYIPYEKAY